MQGKIEIEIKRITLMLHFTQYTQLNGELINKLNKNKRIFVLQ